MRQPGEPAGGLPVVGPGQRRRWRQHRTQRVPERVQAAAVTDLKAAHPDDRGFSGRRGRCAQRAGALFGRGRWRCCFLMSGAAAVVGAGAATGMAPTGAWTAFVVALLARCGRGGRGEADAGRQVAQQGNKGNTAAHGGQQEMFGSSPWTHGSSSGTATACFSLSNVGRNEGQSRDNFCPAAVCARAVLSGRSD